MDVREQITALREQLRYHNEKYYNEDAPEITDYEYDMLQRQLRALEVEHPEMITGCAIPAVKSFKRGLRKQRKRLGRRKFNKNLMQKPGEKHCCRQRIQ